MGSHPIDDIVNRMIRDFIMEHQIDRQTEENWLLIRNTFQLSDTDQKMVYGE